MPTRIDTVHRIFVLACELEDAEREDFVRRECGDDAALRAEVEELLHSDQSGSFLGEDKLADMRRQLGRDDEPMPERIGEFRIIAVLGHGGMGVVYRAVQDQPAREVALKMLRPGFGGAEARARFALEAEALGRLHHPGIAQIFAAGTYAGANDRPYLAMELVEGESLQTWVKRQPSLETRVRMVVQIAEAVHHAHQKGLIHRDLKPGNVLVSAAGRAKVLDFGIARIVDEDRARTMHTHTGQLLGTLAYMSPEQANGDAEKVDVRADVYALGAIAYEMCAGVPPVDVRGDALARGLRRVAEEEPVPLGVRDRKLRGDLQTIVQKALQKEPARRYDSAQAFADDLVRFLQREPIQARPATAAYLLRRFAQRHRGLVAGAVLALVAVLTGSGLAIAWAVHADRAESIAREEARVASRTTDILRSLFVGANPEFAVGRDLSAREILLTGRGIVDKALDEDPASASRVAMIVGDVFAALGDFATAESLLQRAYEGLRRSIAGDDSRIVDALYRRAAARLRAQRYGDAGELFGAALAMHRRLESEPGIFDADCLAGLAKAASHLGNHDEALRLLGEAEPLLERAGDALGLAEHWQAVATTNLMAERLDGADAAFAKAEAQLTRAGKQASLAILLGNVGNLRLRQQRVPEAEALFRRALELAELCYGKESPKLVLPLLNLGSVHAQTDRIVEAEALWRRGMAMGGDETKSTDQGLASLLFNLGRLCAMQDRLDEASAIWQRAEAMESRLRPGKGDHLELLEYLATLRQMQGDARAAEAFRERAAELRERQN